MNKREQKPVRPRNVVLDTLTEAFLPFRDCQPLAIGVHKAILDRLPEIDPAHLRTALRIHTASTRYLKALSQAETRFDLDGTATGEVAAEQRQRALDTLRERFKKRADQDKAEQLAKQRQEKLNALVEKFKPR